MDTTYKIEVTLETITVNGNGIGRNWQFELAVAESSARIAKTIGPDSGARLGMLVHSTRRRGSPGARVTIPVTVVMTELDPRFNDTGLATGAFDVVLTPGRSVGLVSGIVQAVGGDAPRSVALNFRFVAVVTREAAGEGPGEEPGEAQGAPAGGEDAGGAGDESTAKRLEIRLNDPAGPRLAGSTLDPAVREQLRRAINTLAEGAQELASDRGVQEGVRRASTPGARQAVERLARARSMPVLPNPGNPGAPDVLDVPLIPSLDSASESERIRNLPQIRKLDAAIQALSQVPIRYLPVSGPVMVFDEALAVQVVGHEAADVGRPLRVRVIDRTTSRINTPLTDRPGVATLTLQGRELATAPADRPEQRAEAEFELPANGILGGKYLLRGNYGEVSIEAEFVDHRGDRLTARRTFTFRGEFEEEARRREGRRYDDENSFIRVFGSVSEGLQGLLSIINSVIDSTSTASAALSVVPVVGDAIDAASENTLNLLENILQFLEGAIQIATAVLKEQMTAANDATRDRNLELAERLPESGPAGEREVIEDR